MNLKIAFKHFKTILTHKYYVGKYCFKCGLYYQGIVHDLSKFSFTEFLESIKYYTGTKSPIDKAKEEKGYSLAWFHHRGRNPHHHVYWCDNFDEGMTFVKMPFKYLLEMFCDFLGAGIAYSKDKKLNIDSELEWWNNKRKHIALHLYSLYLMDNLMYLLYKYGDKFLSNKKLIKFLKKNYNEGIYWNKSMDWDSFYKTTLKNKNTYNKKEIK